VTSSLELASGASQTFELDVASPVGDQTLTYVFQTNGKEASSSKPRYDFVAAGQQEYTIVASVKDNYGQTSTETRTWKVKVASQADVRQLVEGWLNTYQDAFNRKDVAKLGELLRLDAGKQKNLAGLLENQRNLRVAFRDVKIDKVDSTRAKVSYKRMDEFVDERTGKSMSLSTPIKQAFRVENGRAVLDK
jgi:aminoglycoside N3'-acetyltransferase